MRTWSILNSEEDVEEDEVAVEAVVAVVAVVDEVMVVEAHDQHLCHLKIGNSNNLNFIYCKVNFFALLFF